VSHENDAKGASDATADEAKKANQTAANGGPPPGEPPMEAEVEVRDEGAAPADPLAAARQEAARLKDMWMRTAADFDNYRKRARREVDDARRGGREELLKELLPVFDNMERAMHSAQRATDVKGVVEGLSMILKQFESTLARVDIKKVPSTGTPFDPAVHEAIQQVETDEHPPGTVVAEVQPGYVQGDKLVRAAMVVVAKPKSNDN